MWELTWPCSEQLLGVRKRGVRRLTQGSICNWEVLVSDSPVINHPRPILFFDSSLQGLTFNTHDPGSGFARDQRLQKHKKLNRMTLFPSSVSGRSEAKQIQINNSHLHYTSGWRNYCLRPHVTPLPLTLTYTKQLNEKAKRSLGLLD